MDKPWKVIAAFIGVFVAGAVFGGFFSLGVGAKWLEKESPPAAAPSAPAPVAVTPQVPLPATPVPALPKTGGGNQLTPAQRASLLQLPQTWQAPALMRRYADRLELTSDQKDKINPIIERASADYRRLQQNSFRETGIILQRLQEDIRKELTPDQIAKLEQFEQRQRELLEKNDAKQKKGGGGKAGKKGQPVSAPSAPLSTESTSASATSTPAPVAPTEKKE